MRIGIDARFLTHPQPGGFKTYSEQLVRALLAVDGAHSYLVYLDRAPEARLPEAPNVSYRVVDRPWSLLGMAGREQLGLAYWAARDRLDLLHAPCLTAPLLLPCPLVVTVHDMIWRWPERFDPAAPRGMRVPPGERYFRQVPAWAARRAAAVITVSQAARADIVAELGLPEERVAVTYEAARLTPEELADEGELAARRARFGLAPDYLLAFGSADPRKNLPTLLRAYAALPLALRRRHPLAIVWNHRRPNEALLALAQQLGLQEQLVLLTGVSDDEVVALYRGAALFAFPSRYEGFGLPPLEAMACGTPVVAADNSSLPEILGDAATLVPTDDVPALAAAVEALLLSPELRRSCVERGRRRAARFSWQRCARETIAVYEAVGQRFAVAERDPV